MSRTGALRLALLLLALPLACARLPTPLRRRMALRILDRLTAEGSRDELSIDIGGTLAKVVLFQPRPAPPPDGQRPRLELGDAQLDEAIRQSGEQMLSLYVPQLGGNLHFFVFESRHIDGATAFAVRRSARRSFGRSFGQWASGRREGDLPEPSEIVVRATGAGAYKHQAALSRIGLVLDFSDDLECMVSGLAFLLNHVADELFTVRVEGFRPLATPVAYQQVARNYRKVDGAPPRDFLYVAVSTETLVLEVRGGDDGVTRYRRLGSSCVGGSTFWGLVKLLTSCETYDEVIRLTEMESASSARVDMQVGDIYGGDCPAIGLRGDVIAASFGKLAMRESMLRQQAGRQGASGGGPSGGALWLRYLRTLLRHFEEGFWLVILAIVNSVPGLRQLAHASGLVNFGQTRAASTAMCGSCHAHDVALSLLRLVSNNIGHISCLYAEQANVPQVVFGGSFIRDHPYTIATIASALHFYSRGAVQPLFLQHDGFVGAIGAHVAGRPIAANVRARLQPESDAAPASAASAPEGRPAMARARRPGADEGDEGAR